MAKKTTKKSTSHEYHSLTEAPKKSMPEMAVPMPKIEEKVIVKPPPPEPIPEHPDYTIRRIHNHFIGNPNYRKPMTIWLITRYCMIHTDNEDVETPKLMEIVMKHYKDIESFKFEGKLAYKLKKIVLDW